VHRFVNGSILCGDGSLADALVVDDGRVVAIGPDAHDDRGRRLTEVDLGGGLLLPGFRDGHAHPLWGGIDLRRCPLDRCRSVNEIVTAVGAYAAARPELSWIQAGPYDPSVLPDGRADAAWLDAVVPDRPVKLSAADYHTAWVNSRALQLAGIDSDVADPPLGQIVRRADGSPSGMLVEWGAIELVDRLIPEPDADERAAGLDAAMQHFVRNGLVWAQDAAVSIDDARTYRAAAERDQLPVRINLAWRAEPDAWRTQLADYGVARRDLEADRSCEGRLTARTVKFFADGVIEQGTGFVLEPYEVEPHDCGLPNWKPDELAEAVASAASQGYQIHIHAIGDGGVRMALDAIEHAARVNGAFPERPVIAHTQLVDPADRQRFASLGVIANFEPLWARLDPVNRDLTIPRLGPRRASLQYPIATLARQGAPISFGSDWPVSSVSPLEGLSVAVTRQMPDGTPADGWLPDERVAIGAAVRAYTAGSAYQAFDDARGTIEVGQRADFCLAGSDITAIAGLEVAEVEVIGTWVDGVEVWRA
jgi:predicted amidohydrolase YtcJ